MDEEKIRMNREKVEQMFSEMDSAKPSVKPEPKIKPDHSGKRQTSLAEMLENVGVEFEELTSPKYSKVMRNLGKEEKEIHELMCAPFPAMVIKMILEHHVSPEKMHQLSEAYAEIASAYLYAIVKAAATESLDNITLPFIDEEDLRDPLLSKIEQKTACIIAGYCTAILGLTESMVGERIADSLHTILHLFAISLTDPLAQYITETRKKNDLGG